MRSPRSRSWIRYALVAAWLICMISLASWWVLFSLEQVERLVAANVDPAGDLIRYQKMLMLEGSFLVMLMTGGALALVIFMYRERRERRRLEEFLATFSHELKTPLAGVLLQAEILKEQCAEQGASLPIEPFVVDLSRLTIQLENALLLATPGALQLFPQTIALEEAITRCSQHIPLLAVTIEGSAQVRADQRALDIILSNLLHNAMKHGDARRVAMTISLLPHAMVRLLCVDDGKGFPGDHAKLGALFCRHYEGSGSGIGLYLSRQLAKKMGGDLTIPAAQQGFGVQLELPQAP